MKKMLRSIIINHQNIVKNYPKKKSFIFNRILAFPDIEGINNSIKQYLSMSNDINAKILLAKIQFKQKNYQDSYDLLLIYSNNEQNIIPQSDIMCVRKYSGSVGQLLYSVQMQL